MFPFVARRTGVEPAQLQVDHDEMTAAIEAAEAALVAREGVAEAVTRFHDILIAHLDREEELVVPVFLALAPGAAWAMLHGG